MQVHMIWGQRFGADEGMAEIIDAWDEYCVEENPDGFAYALLKARANVRSELNKNGDFVNVAVIVVTVNSAQIEKILNPPNKVMGTVLTQPEPTTEEAKQLGEQALRHLRSLTSFAYQAGFHELGYDPVKEVAKLLSLDAPIGESEVSKCKECHQPIPYHKMDCSLRNKRVQ